MFDVIPTKDASVVKLALKGRLDSVTAPIFEQKLESLLKDGPFKVVMACDELMFISSAGLRVFLTFAKKVKKQNGNLALAGMQPTVYAVFESSGFLNFLKLFSSIEEALAHVNPSA